jgi:NIPSNAP
MLGSTSALYEVVSGQVRLGKQEEFCRLHRDALLPMICDAGIEPVLLLLTELGRFLRFLDIYRYPSLTEYGMRTDAFLRDRRLAEYYEKVGACIDGSIVVELALEFPHITGTKRHD